MFSIPREKIVHEIGISAVSPKAPLLMLYAIGSGSYTEAQRQQLYNLILRAFGEVANGMNFAKRIFSTQAPDFIRQQVSGPK